MSTEPASTLLQLLPHPAGVTPAGLELTTQCQRQGAQLQLTYRIRGDHTQLRLPASDQTGRRDELWRTTCLEAFIQRRGQDGYQEYNFSPTGAWACYAFSQYRGQPHSPDCDPPEIRCNIEDDELQLQATITDVAVGTLQIGISAVVEDQAGQLSYWALHHPANQPDFHNAAGFVLTLE